MKGFKLLITKPEAAALLSAPNRCTFWDELKQLKFLYDGEISLFL